MSGAPEPLVSAALARGDVRHGFFTRQGGVSDGIYASLNCGLGSGDDRAAVTENRRRAATALLGAPAPVLTAYQVHSAEAAIVTAPFTGAPPKVDALVTQTPGLVVGALAADCAPVLLADAAAGVVAAAHAGWRGALSGVVGAALEAMESLGADRKRTTVVVGPCIGQASYEVGLEFEAAFLERDAANGRYFLPGKTAEKRQFDLSGYVAARAEALGVGAVERIERDVYAAPETFFSYRMSRRRDEPDYGRLLSAIALV